MWCSDASAFVSPNCTRISFMGRSELWLSFSLMLHLRLPEKLSRRKKKKQQEQRIEKGRPTHRHTCPFPVSVYYAALILLRRLPPSLERHMFRVKPSFFLSLLKKDERFAQSQTRCHPHQPTEPDDASECFASPRFQINLRLREEGGRGGGR